MPDIRFSNSGTNTNALKLNTLFMRHLLSVPIFVCCYTFLNSNNLVAQDYQSAHHDAIKIMPYKATAKPEIFETAFFPGTQIKEDTFLINFFALNIGKIDVKNGSLIAAEPWWVYNQHPFLMKFPKGQFDVQLAIAKIDQKEFVAFSRILFSDNPVDHWEFALKEGQKQISIFSDSIYFYPVDGGVGGFIDDNSYANFQALDKGSQTQIMDTLTKELEKNNNLYANIRFKNVNIVAFSSGLGDGRYATYIGIDKEGNPCRLLTDFELIYWQNK